MTTTVSGESEYDWSKTEAEKVIEPPPKLRTYTTADILALPPPSYLIEGWLPKAAMAVLHAKGNTGKSLVAIDWGCRIATGLDWHGHQVTQAPVVYAALEDNVGVRVAAWMEYNDRPIPDESMLWIIDGINLRMQHVVDQLVETALEIGAGLVIVDTISRAMPAFKEVASEEMGIVTAAADRLRREADTTTLFLHHEPHALARARGHSSLYDDSDSQFGLEAINPPGTIRLSCSKQRNGPRPVPVLLDIVDVTEIPGSVSVRSSVGVTLLAQLNDSVQSLGSLLGSRPELQGARYGELRKAAEKYEGMTESTFKRSLKALVDKGFVVKTGEGKDSRYHPADWFQTLPEED